MHRYSRAVCPEPIWDPGEGGRGPGDECEADFDCRPGTHCVAAPGSTNDCIAPSCETDADCESGSICVCSPGYKTGESGRDVLFGRCVQAECTADDDCTEGALCVSDLINDEAAEFSCRQPL